MKYAVPLVLREDLLTSHRFSAAVESDESAAYASGATETLWTTLERRHGKFTIQATMRNLGTQRTQTVVRSAERAQLIPELNQLAAELDKNATYFSTRNEQALAAYTAAFEANTLQAKQTDLNKAVTIDPAFGLGYISLIDLQSQTAQQDLKPLIARAASFRQSFSPLDKVRFDAVYRRVSGTPIAQQAVAEEAVLRMTPNDPEALAALGSDRYFQGDMHEAEQLLRRAIALDPRNIQFKGQLAELLFSTSRFRGAENTLATMKDNAAILPALATCILLEGEKARAGTTFEGYLNARQNGDDPFVPVARATWMAISGSLGKAIDYLESVPPTQAAARSLAISQVSIWQMQSNDSANAEKSVAEARKLAKIPAAKIYAAQAALIVRPDEPREKLQQAIKSSPLDSASKQNVLGYNLFLHGHYADAAQVWRNVVNQTNGTDPRAKTMLAVSLERSGKPAEAQKVGVRPFFPNLTGGDQFSALSFNEMAQFLKLGSH